MYTLLCIGARADIKDKFARTPLKVAREQLSQQSDQEGKQRYKKVHEGTHKTLDLFKGCRHESFTILIYACQA